MDKTVKVALWGAGSMADYHVQGFRQAGAEVVAILDKNLERAKAYAARQDIPLAMQTLDELFAKVKPDGISIITPNKFHKELSIEALKRKMHVFCEKPPALSAAEVREMKAAAVKAHRILTFDFNNRCREEVHALMDYIHAGEVGPIQSGQALWIRRAGIPGFGGWFTNKSMAGGGPLIDLLHMLDLALYFMGYPEPEYALSQTFDDKIQDARFKGPWGIPDMENGVCDVENACHAFLRFKTGQVLFVRSSWAEMVEREEIYVRVQGTKAGAIIRRRFGSDGIDITSRDDAKLFRVEHGRQVNSSLIYMPDVDMGRTSSPANFVRAIRGEEEPLVKPDEAIRLMHIIDGIYLSASSGRPVKYGKTGVAPL